MGRQKRKINSPLQKDDGKSRRTTEENVDDMEGDDSGEGGQKDVIEDLKEFIRNENARSNKSLAQEIRQYNEERMTAMETSLNFALATNETLSKRLVEVERRAQRAETELFQCTKRLYLVEEQLDQIQQNELQDWLIFSGPAIPRLSRAGRDRDASQMLCSMIRQHMGFEMDVAQLKEVFRDERQIRARFTAVGVGSDRFLLLRNKTKLRGSGLYIRERLTPHRQKIFNELLQFKMARQVSAVFTRDGTVFVVVGQRDRPRPVRTEAAVERLVQQLLESSEPNSQQLTGDPGSQQARSSGPARWPTAAGEHRDGDAAGRDGTSALVTRGGAPNPAGRQAEPLRHRPDEYRASAEPDQRHQPADDGTAVTRDELVRSSSAPGATASPPPTAGSSSAGVQDGPQQAPPGGEGGGGLSAVTEQAPGKRSDGQHAPVSSMGDIRRRFRGDMRQFVTVHSKSD